jgi:gamma-butyrobetaine dioxygenase
MSTATPLPTWRWLLDNCPCPQCLHPITRERTVTLVDQWDVQPMSITTGEHSTVTVDWGGGHVGVFPVEMLMARPEFALRNRELLPLQRINHSELATERGMVRWLTALLANGAVIVEDTPDVTGEVIRLAELVGYARPTNFGTIFDVESRPDPNNSAYTAAGLDLHTDLPNWANPPDFQFLHALTSDASGGNSMLADGFAVANAFRSQDPKAFATLATTPVPFRFHDDVDDIRFSAPIIELDSDDEPVSIRFNNWIRDVDPFADEQFYDAYLAFWQLLRDPAHVVELRLDAGDTLCFDNRRVLHGRSEFDPQSGRRHLQGCYVDRDMVESRLRRLLLV